jgi:hypothetical protein
VTFPWLLTKSFASHIPSVNCASRENGGRYYIGSETRNEAASLPTNSIMILIMKKKQKKLVKEIKPWRAFEQAVFAFLQLLLEYDPNATVRYNPPKIDRDTGKKQQVDAWIDYKIGGHLPVKMLISCKDHGRKLDVGDIRTFIQERDDSGATAGALYSRSGFTQDAVKKAQSRGIGCFQLWRDRPADSTVKEVYRWYWCCDSGALIDVDLGEIESPPKTWGEFFAYRIPKNGYDESVAECLQAAYQTGKERAIKEQAARPGISVFPDDFACRVDLEDSPGRTTKVTIICRWRRFQGKLSASLLNGSYCLETGEFAGTITGPPIHVTFPPPASDWQELSLNPPPPRLKHFVFMKNSAGVIEMLRESFMQTALTSGGRIP